MPFAVVYRRQDVSEAALLGSKFHEVLQAAAALATTSPDEGGTVNPEDVDVHYVTRPTADRANYPLTIRVHARRLPERLLGHEQRTAALNAELAAGVPNGVEYCASINLTNEVWGGGTGTHR